VLYRHFPRVRSPARARAKEPASARDSVPGVAPGGYNPGVTSLRPLVILLAALPCAALAAPQDFATWLQAFRKDAAKAKLSPKALAALDGLEPLPEVVELDKKQPEFRLTLEEYLRKVVSPVRIAAGHERLAAHNEVLGEVSDKYGVPPEFIVALWGAESNYGSRQGDFSIVAALATLAHDGRRAQLFRAQLLDALKIIDQGHITAEAMKGSWAGAMGHCQFMPSTFLGYAVDHDGDGRRDIWGTLPDVFGSTANYLRKMGWRRGEPWGQPVQLPADFDKSWVGVDKPRPMKEWRELGLTTASGAPLPTNLPEASLVRPGKEPGPAYLVHRNFRVLLRWNRSEYFAASVSLLADALAQPPLQAAGAAPAAGTPPNAPSP
jgi:membrane-bound lytic murein transglycosylase B